MNNFLEEEFGHKCSLPEGWEHVFPVPPLETVHFPMNLPKRVLRGHLEGTYLYEESPHQQMIKRIEKKAMKYFCE